MSSLTTRPSGIATLGDFLILEDEGAKSAVVLAPDRGALVTSFRVVERELLYLEEPTLVDPSKNVRGGVPVLFPSPGKLENDTWSRGGQRSVMKQHGFARNLPWTVRDGTPAGAAAVTLMLFSSDATLAQYPWAFEASLTFALTGACLRITSSVRNTGNSGMPFGLGYHPYFAVKNKAGARVDTRATRAFDNVTKEIAPFTGFDLTAKEVDLHLLDHGSSGSALHFGDGARIDIRASADFTRWVVWTLEGKGFVCVEPWTCPGNALNTGENVLVVPPGESRDGWIELEFSP